MKVPSEQTTKVAAEVVKLLIEVGCLAFVLADLYLIYLAYPYVLGWFK